MRALRKPILDARILSLQKKVQELEQGIDEIMIEKIIDTRITPHLHPEAGVRACQPLKRSGYQKKLRRPTVF